MVAGRSSPNAEQNSQTSQDDLEWEPIPKKRKPRLASLFICLFTAIEIIAYGFVDKSVFEYKPVNNISTNKLERIKNGSIIIYTMEEKETYPVLFNLGLGLLSIILGTFVDRLSLIFEELFHLKSRYNRSIVKVFKACFSGISWPAVIVIFLVGAISLVLARMTSFKLGDLMYILGGIGVGPLVMHLLNLNTQSEVDVSRLLEEKRLYPAYTIAWNYYFHYLRKALPIFNESFSESNIPVQDQGTGQLGSSDQTTQPKVQLSLKKMILLISHNCKTKNNLEELDNHIRKITDIQNNGYNFPVYGLTYNGKEQKYVVLYANEPLETLKEMSQSERIKAIHENECEQQVKLLCRALVSEILTDPLDDVCNDMCTLVPIMAENARSLQNGGLVKLIMTKVKADECTPNQDELPGFMKAPTPSKKTVHPQETGNVSVQDKKTGPDLVENNQPDLPSSHTVNIDHFGGKAQYSKQDHFADSRDEHKNDALLHTEERQEDRLGRDKEPVNEDAQAHDKGNEHQQLASNSVNGEGNSPRGEMDNDRRPTTSYNPSISNYAGETENQPMSSNFVYEEELCPSRKEYELRSGTSYNPPALNCDDKPRSGTISIL